MDKIIIIFLSVISYLLIGFISDIYVAAKNPDIPERKIVSTFLWITLWPAGWILVFLLSFLNNNLKHIAKFVNKLLIKKIVKVRTSIIHKLNPQANLKK